MCFLLFKGHSDLVSICSLVLSFKFVFFFFFFYAGGRRSKVQT
jgi:hypothetical protein